MGHLASCARMASALVPFPLPSGLGKCLPVLCLLALWALLEQKVGFKSVAVVRQGLLILTVSSDQNTQTEITKPWGLWVC